MERRCQYKDCTQEVTGHGNRRYCTRHFSTAISDNQNAYNTKNGYAPTLSQDERHRRQIERHRRHNARIQGLVPDEAFMAYQEAKAQALAEKRAARLAQYEQHLGRQEKRK